MLTSHDTYEHDAVDREVRRTMPGGAVVETDHDGLRAEVIDALGHVEVTDALGHVTVVEHDPLGRPVTVTDAAMGVTRYKRGPFGALYTVTDPAGAVTRTRRDAFGRVRQLDHPDRGTTVFTSGPAWTAYGGKRILRTHASRRQGRVLSVGKGILTWRSYWT
ncbi:hypothetical protein WMF38_30010 [Sorangium sp. So ce118]